MRWLVMRLGRFWKVATDREWSLLGFLKKKAFQGSRVITHTY